LGWELFEIFDIKERHGFNKMDLKLYVTDNIKNNFLWILLGTPAFYLIMLIIEWGGDLLYIWLTGLILGYIIIFKYLFINFIAPMYNKYT
jgi:STE24 endopeptidase